MGVSVLVLREKNGSAHRSTGVFFCRNNMWSHITKLKPIKSLWNGTKKTGPSFFPIISLLPLPLSLLLPLPSSKITAILNARQYLWGLCKSRSFQRGKVLMAPISSDLSQSHVRSRVHSSWRVFLPLSLPPETEKRHQPKATSKNLSKKMKRNSGAGATSRLLAKFRSLKFKVRDATVRCDIPT